jgi:hypothetical protein
MYGWIGLFFAWLVFTILVGVLAAKRGQSVFVAVILSVLFSPLMGFIYVLVMGTNEEELAEKAVFSGVMRKCPACAELVKAEASVCKHCGSNMPPRAAIPGDEAGMTIPELRAKYGITFSDGSYYWEGKKFSRFDDAIEGARLAVNGPRT